MSYTIESWCNKFAASARECPSCDIEVLLLYVNLNAQMQTGIPDLASALLKNSSESRYAKLPYTFARQILFRSQKFCYFSPERENIYRFSILSNENILDKIISESKQRRCISLYLNCYKSCNRISLWIYFAGI
jgi:hypothetical protein